MNPTAPQYPLIVTRRGAIEKTLALGLLGSFWPVIPSEAEEKLPEQKANTMTPNPRLFSFVGGREGPWKSTESRTIKGDSLPAIERLQIVAGNVTPKPIGGAWALHGATSDERYVIRPEKEQLVAKSPALARPEADSAVLIPIKKNAKWWTMTQDERSRIFEEKSHHAQIGLDYLPAIARRLHHCRDLSELEPFDFLTWFEFSKADSAEFDKLLSRLRASEEWKYVQRQVEFRLTRDGSNESK